MKERRSGRLVAGVDSSTQSTKVLLCRADNGEVVAQGSAPHPPGTECHPHRWWTALQQAGNGLLEQAAAIAIAGQQHGMVVLDADGEVIRPALPVRSAHPAELPAEDRRRARGAAVTRSGRSRRRDWRRRGARGFGPLTFATTYPSPAKRRQRSGGNVRQVAARTRPVSPGTGRDAAPAGMPTKVRS